jgi:hypothetical protein
MILTPSLPHSLSHPPSFTPRHSFFLTHSLTLSQYPPLSLSIPRLSLPPFLPPSLSLPLSLVAFLPLDPYLSLTLPLVSSLCHSPSLSSLLSCTLTHCTSLPHTRTSLSIFHQSLSLLIYLTIPPSLPPFSPTQFLTPPLFPTIPLSHPIISFCLQFYLSPHSLYYPPLSHPFTSHISLSLLFVPPSLSLSFLNSPSPPL